MDFINTLIGLLPEPYGQIVIGFWALIGALVTFATPIVGLTKTPTDDKILSQIKNFLWRFSVVDPKDAK